MMKGWLGVAFFVGWSVVCLLLGFCQQDAVASVNTHRPRAASWNRSLVSFVEPARASPTAGCKASGFFTSHEAVPAGRDPAPRKACAGPLESLAAPIVFSRERDGSPRSFDTRGPPGNVRGPCSTAGLPARLAAGSKRTAFIPEAHRGAARHDAEKNEGFCNSL